MQGRSPTSAPRLKAVATEEYCKPGRAQIGNLHFTPATACCGRDVVLTGIGPGSESLRTRHNTFVFRAMARALGSANIAISRGQSPLSFWRVVVVAQVQRATLIRSCVRRWHRRPVEVSRRLPSATL